MNNTINYKLSFIFLSALMLLASSVFYETALAHGFHPERIEVDENAVGGPQEADPEKEALEKQIREREKALQQMEAQISETQQTLQGVVNQKQTLKRDVTTIDYTINQLNSSVQAGQISIEKLQLETELLEDEKGDIESRIDKKREALAQALAQMYEEKQVNLFERILQDRTLSASASTIQNLENIKNELLLNIAELKLLRNDLDQNIEQTEEKAGEIQKETVYLSHRKEIVAEQKQEKNRLLQQTQSQEALYQQQLEELNQDRNKIFKEIEEISAKLRSQVDLNAIALKFKGLLQAPVKGGILTQGYGRTSFAIRTYPSQWHNGVDIAAPVGTPVVSGDDGVVVFAMNQDRYCYKRGYGNLVVVRHYNGLTTLHAHLSGIAVTKGQAIDRGQTIGYLGSTGWSTGPHLHYVVFDTSTYQERSPSSCGVMPIGGDLNPFDYLPSPINGRW